MCDRILYDGNATIIPTEYASYGDAAAIKISDHNLVYTDFQVNFKNKYN